MPDGRIGRFEVPEGTTPEQVMQYAQGMGPSTPPPVSARQAEDASMAAYEAAPVDTSRRPPNLEDYAKDVFGFKDYAYRGNLLPFGEDAQGNKELATPKILKDVATLALLPGHAARGGSYTPQDTLALAGLMSPMSPAARVGELTPAYMRPGLKAKKTVVPTAQELKEAAKGGYDKAAGMDVEYSAQAVKNLGDNIIAKLENESRIRPLNKKLFALLDEIRNPPADSTVTLPNLDNFRKQLSFLAGDKDPAKAAAARIALGKLDDFLELGGVETAASGGAVAGAAAPQTLPALQGEGARSAAQRAGGILKDARGNYAASARSQALADIGDASELRAAANNSGQNIGNTLRQKLASLRLSGKGSRGFTKEELNAIEQVINGTASTNALRRVSNLLGGGGGLGQLMVGSAGAGYGGAVGGFPGAVVGALPAVAGMAARKGANVLTTRQLENLAKMTRTRSPLYAQRVANPVMKETTPVEAELVRRLALALGVQDKRNERRPPGLLDDLDNMF